MASSKYNPISIIQKWMDSMAGQTFMQYAYSWGAAVVILGTLFKLTHLEGANLMLFIGMGTEVFVFFIAGFERVTEKVEEKLAAQTGGVIYGGAPVVGDAAALNGAVVAGLPAGEAADTDAEATEAAVQEDGAPIVIGGGVPKSGVVYAGGPIVAGGSVMAGSPVVVGGSVTEGAGVAEGAAISPAAIQATDPSAIEEAVKNYAEELTELTEVLGRVKIQASRMSTDSEEMENLNRTLTGIATVYELQLRNISKQVNTIEQIDEQTKRMAHQIEELNNVYARMIQALTVNMGGSPVAPSTEA